jgi:hypothetical protein
LEGSWSSQIPGIAAINPKIPMQLAAGADNARIAAVPAACEDSILRPKFQRLNELLYL